MLKRRRLKLMLQMIVLAVVAWGIHRSVEKSASQLRQQQAQLRASAQELRALATATEDLHHRHQLMQQAEQLGRSADDYWRADPLGLVLAGTLYALGMLPASLFWRRCLAALNQPTHLLTILWAYFYGNLGKYFPGKAMVIILRVDALNKLGIQKTATSITVFMETLTMMAVGGAIAAICMILLNLDWRLTLLSLGLLLLTFLPIYPAFLRLLVPKLQRGVDAEIIATWTRRVDGQLFAGGWALLCLTWFCFGLSLMLVMRSLPSLQLEVSLTTFALSCLGACALAVVLGFVSLLPGGAGVREVVLSTVLIPAVGPVAALSGAVWLRIVWLATELLVVGLLFVIKSWLASPPVFPQLSPSEA